MLDRTQHNAHADDTLNEHADVRYGETPLGWHAKIIGARDLRVIASTALGTLRALYRRCMELGAFAAAEVVDQRIGEELRRQAAF